MCLCMRLISWPFVYTPENYCRLQNSNAITNMGFIGHNIVFLTLTAGAPGSAQYACLLRWTKVS